MSMFLFILAAAGVLAPEKRTYQCDVRRNDEATVAAVSISFVVPPRDPSDTGRIALQNLQIEDKAFVFVFLTAGPLIGDSAQNGVIRVRPKPFYWPNFTSGIKLTPADTFGQMLLAAKYTTATGKRGDSKTGFFDEFSGTCNPIPLSASKSGDRS